MSDAEAFLANYNQNLNAQISARWPAQFIEPYTIEDCLKLTADKEVLLAVDRRTKDKVILRSAAVNPGEVQDTEYDVLTQLDHPGIPKAYGALVHDGRSYLARQYLEGTPLDEVISRRTFTPPQIRAAALQLATILDYIHTQNPPVIHRDLKPQNIIAGPDGSFGLTDFGIARTFKDGEGSDTHFAGTLPYAAPEQYGYAQTSPQTDIYALGIVMIYLATGSPSRQGWEAAIPDTGLRKLIGKCIAFDPGGRFQSASAILKKLDPANRRQKLAIGITIGVLAVGALGTGTAFMANLFESPSSIRPPESSTPANASPQGENQPPQSPPATGTSDFLFDSAKDGNLPGNLVNGGYAVEGDGSIYLAAKGAIHQLDGGGRSIKKWDFADPKSLNYYQGALYFVDGGSLWQLDLATSTSKMLVNDRVGAAIVSNNALYIADSFQGLALTQVDFDGKTLSRVDEGQEAYYRVLVDGYVYYAKGAEGRKLFRIDLATGKETVIYAAETAWLSYYDGKIYFSDFTVPGRVISHNLSDGIQMELTPGSYSFTNASPYGIAVSSPDDQSLVLLSLDGKSQTTLAKAPSAFPNIAGGWIFYQNKDDNENIWMVRPNGENNHLFEP
ncbi:MAG: DUF5050 domain-containing protein [Propionibacteriaceae bacterium]|nr:DUF5050 domain-containing protein [Propionibacteriaceae bacterium]